MEAYRDGDASAFESLYTRHRAPLYRYIRRQCVNSAQADELFQDVWMRLIAARERYTVSAKFTTYLYRIAHNRLVDHYRASDRREVPLNDESLEDTAPLYHSEDSPDDALARSRRATRVRTALRSLPPEQRDAFLLHEEAGLSLEEIAQMSGVGRETVKSRLRYALGKLRRRLTPED